MTSSSWMHAFVDVPAEDVATAHTFWSSVLGWPVGDPWPGHPEFTSFVPTRRRALRPRAAHRRAPADPPRPRRRYRRDTARLEGLGASRGYRGAGLASDGLARRPAVLRVRGVVAARAADGGRVAGRPPQQAGAAHRRRARRPVRPGAGVLARGHRLGRRGRRRPRVPPAGAPPGSPLQLLVQRLGADDGAQQARAHLDLGADDVDAEVERVRSLGARVLWPGNGFVALRDPLGLPFCVTGNDPTR